MNEKIPNQNNIYQTITDRIIKQLEDHKLTWDKPWVTVGMDGELAGNAETGNKYRGINQLLLGYEADKRGYPLNKWLTFKQIKELGGSVEKGQRASHVMAYITEFKDVAGNKLKEDEVKYFNEDKKKELGIKENNYRVLHSVFNVFQTKGLPEQFYQVNTADIPGPFELNDKAEEVIKNTGAKIEYVLSNKAYYLPGSDVIQIPAREQFKGQEPFYSTVFHELGHWTGHESRLGRKFGKEETKTYAREELVAELTSAFICAELGFSKQITNNTAYVDSWLKKLNDDKKYIFKAVIKAEKAANYVWELHRQKSREDRNMQQDKAPDVSKPPAPEEPAMQKAVAARGPKLFSEAYFEYLKQKDLARNPWKSMSREER